MPSIAFRQLPLTLIAAALVISLACGSHLLAALEPDVAPIRGTVETHSTEKELRLGMAYFTGQGVAQDRKIAAYWYEKAAKAGDPIAQLQMGYLYQSGQGVPRDPALAVHWYQLASASGLTNAKVNLGVAYMWGLGVERNQALAEKLFEEAAAKGNGLADCYVGDTYYFGNGVNQDRDAARKWFEAGVKRHDPQSTFNLATFYYSDKASSRKEAVLLRDAAKAGYVPAMLTLGHLLIDNPDLARNSQEAVDLLEKSAGAGTWRSSVILGIVARDGKGGPQDSKAAYYHFKVAALQGGQEAERIVANDLRILSTTISADQRKSIDNEASSWSQQHRVALQFVYNDGDNRKESPAYALAMPNGGTHALELVPTPPM